MGKDMSYDVSFDGKRKKSLGSKLNFCAAIFSEIFVANISILSL